MVSLYRRTRDVLRKCSLQIEVAVYYFVIFVKTNYYCFIVFTEFPDCAMLRRHPAPPPSNFDPLIKAGKQQGFEIKVDCGKSLADSLNAAVDAKNTYFNTMLRMIATRD